MAATTEAVPAPTGATEAVPTTDGHVPVIDLNALLNLKEGDAESQAAYDAECKKVADALHEYSILIVRDPRVTQADNNGFLDLLEQYFESPEEDRQKDVRKELSYQVGATPSKTELPKNHCGRMKAYKEADAPLSLCPPERDVKWRFFWRVGERPADTKFAELNAEPVVPAAFPAWAPTMDGWGAKLLGAGQDIAQMAATGFGLPSDAFTSRMTAGPHLLAPTASDFNKFSAPGTVLAGFHYDLNFITVHGKSRFPGLFIWTRSGQKLRVVVPDGCLLMQAGKQMEFLTGGHVKAGFHEVVVVSQTTAAIEAAKEAARSLWRISSTCFTHIASDVTLTPLGDFATPAAQEEYPATSTGDQVNAELASINLGAGSTGSGE